MAAGAFTENLIQATHLFLLKRIKAASQNLLSRGDNNKGLRVILGHGDFKIMHLGHCQGTHQDGPFRTGIHALA